MLVINCLRLLSTLRVAYVWLICPSSVADCL